MICNLAKGTTRIWAVTGCVIPKHKALAVGTLKSAIRQAGITADNFVAAYKGK
ncbi:MAG: hypothetical protein GY857_08640 [Desulfobacula sp.]|nr:hypothetical protein [Desulfobacula sp.]